MKPVVKWAGGKTQLLEHINKLLPPEFDCYYEPFLGGGAVLLDLKPQKAIVNDNNAELINMYLQIKRNVDAVVYALYTLDNRHESSDDAKAFYFSMREEYNKNIGTNTPEQAARLIYINKHCFNGLYRVNSKGFFNVPFNNKIKGDSFDENNIRQLSAYLENVEIMACDFEKSLESIKKGDFVFFDSPYVPVNATSFTDYTKEGFDYEDHVRLSETFKKLTEKGVYCMLTNHNVDLVKELYDGFNIKTVQVSRLINSKASGRTGEEVIITNYDV